jgi:hypothetical protein
MPPGYPPDPTSKRVQIDIAGCCGRSRHDFESSLALRTAAPPSTPS